MSHADSSRVDDALAELGRSRSAPTRPARAALEHPLIAALKRAGTRHVWADSASTRELSEAVGEAPIEGLDGNTANQPLVSKVVDQYLSSAPEWIRELRDQAALPDAVRIPLLYAVLCARIGNAWVDAFGAGRHWETSLQLHMSLSHDPDSARRIGRLLHRMVPNGLVKVPFTPDAPECLLVARDLEREGIPVNLTSTFSARQVVVAAMLANVTRTNIFMGRLNQGLQAALLGEHVDLESQRMLLRLRADQGVKTELIVASLRDWRTFVYAAGCDVFTAPVAVLAEFLEQAEVSADAIQSQLDTSYEERLEISPQVLERLGSDRIARLYRVEPELVELLRELRAHPEDAFYDGDTLYKRIEQAGFGDLFHVPSEAERTEISQAKLPQLDGELIGRIPIDTHYTLLANADFSKYQEQIDRELRRHAERATDLDRQ